VHDRRTGRDASGANGPEKAALSFIDQANLIIQDAGARASLFVAAGCRGAGITLLGLILIEVGLDASLGLAKGAALPLCGGVAIGSLLAFTQRHPRRSRGLVPAGLTGLAGALAWAAAIPDAGWGVWLAVGLFGGLVHVPLAAVYRDRLPPKAAGVGVAMLHLLTLASAVSTAGALAALLRWHVTGIGAILCAAAGLAAVAALLAWRLWYRESLEQALEIAIWPIYRIRGRGPGLADCPRSGPILVVANHSSWFDPLWLAKLLPRRLTPMMTSVFFDLPVLHWLMTRVVHAIRVQASTYRREAPELKEAVAALDRGECVVMFPEGMLRRRADQPLRQFGQGVWHILAERPTTPVVVCWIEGGWGSYMSYAGGPPLVNKRPDWWRRIAIAVAAPEILAPELLTNDRVTRTHLMKACLAARRYLGLEPLTADVPALQADEARS
jgi:1-acyl-sn-glycerol-3-phosphate acyltransferase